MPISSDDNKYYDFEALFFEGIAMGLSTHVLDTAHGKPAAGLRIEFSVREGADWKLLKTVLTFLPMLKTLPQVVGTMHHKDLATLPWLAGK